VAPVGMPSPCGEADAGPLKGHAADLGVQEPPRGFLGNHRREREVEFLEPASGPDVFQIARLAPVAQGASVAMHRELLAALDEAQLPHFSQARHQFELRQQRGGTGERTACGLDTDARGTEPALAHEIDERLRPLRAQRRPLPEPRVLAVDRHRADPHRAALERAAQVMGGQLVHDRERVALARHDDRDRALPGLHVDVKIGRPLEEIAGNERQRVERIGVHHPAHQTAAIVEGVAGEERHAQAFHSARRA